MKFGIAGGSCSGKTTLTRALAEGHGWQYVSLDDYFLPSADFPRVYDRPDYDRVEAVDWDRAISDIEAMRGDVLVEGFLLLAEPRLAECMNLTFFVDTPEDVRIGRRLQRDNRNASDYDYITIHLRNRHNELVEPTKFRADIILDGTHSTNYMEQIVTEYCEVLQETPTYVARPLVGFAA